MKNLIIAIILIFAGLNEVQSQSNRLIVNTINNSAGTDELIHVYIDNVDGLTGAGVNYGINRSNPHTITSTSRLSISGDTFDNYGTPYRVISSNGAGDCFADFFITSTTAHWGGGILYRNNAEIDNQFLIIPTHLTRVFRYFRGSVSETSQALDWTGVERTTGNTITVIISYSRGNMTIEFSDGREPIEFFQADWRTGGYIAAQQRIIDELCRLFINPRCP